MLGKFRKFVSSTTGNTAMIFALSAMPLVMAVGAAVDYSRASQAHAVLQAAVDSAALGTSADRELVAQIMLGKGEAELKQRVENYLKANDALDVLNSLDAITAKYDETKQSVVVSVKGSLRMSLMTLAGIQRLDIGTTAEVGIGSNALEVALVLDNTGSMGGQKLTDLKSAALDLVEMLFKNGNNSAKLAVGIVPFSEYVNIGVTTPTHGWLDNFTYPAGSVWQGCVGSRPTPQDESIALGSLDKYTPVGVPNCVTPMLRLTSDRLAIENKIAELGAQGRTYIPIGLLWGWNMLTREHPLNDAMSQADMKKLGGTKALVLMTDGANTVSTSGTALHDGYDVIDANALTAKLCANAKADGIEIFTVAFQVSDVAIKQILDDCASEPDMAFDATSSATLKVAFMKIGQQLATLHLSR
jgi:Putative Flp pilus-assembly TadE/G-like